MINKVGGSVDRVNAQLDKLDQATDSAVDAVDAIDQAVRTVSFAIRRPVELAAGLSSGARARLRDAAHPPRLAGGGRERARRPRPAAGPTSPRSSRRRA